MVEWLLMKIEDINFEFLLMNIELKENKYNYVILAMLVEAHNLKKVSEVLKDLGYTPTKDSFSHYKVSLFY